MVNKHIIGNETMMKGMRRYYNTWKFKHPTDIDLIRIMEKESGMELDWYLETFVYTTKTIDYGIGAVSTNGTETMVKLERIGDMMMPVDLYVEYADGTSEILYMPLRIMRGEKPVEFENIQRRTLQAWPWTYPTYTLKIGRPLSEIKRIEIDATERMADIDRSNNTYEAMDQTEVFEDPTK